MTKGPRMTSVISRENILIIKPNAFSMNLYQSKWGKKKSVRSPNVPHRPSNSCGFIAVSSYWYIESHLPWRTGCFWNSPYLPLTGTVCVCVCVAVVGRGGGWVRWQTYLPLSWSSISYSGDRNKNKNSLYLWGGDTFFLLTSSTPTQDHVPTEGVST